MSKTLSFNKPEDSIYIDDVKSEDFITCHNYVLCIQDDTKKYIWFDVESASVSPRTFNTIEDAVIFLKNKHVDDEEKVLVHNKHDEYFSELIRIIESL